MKATLLGGRAGSKGRAWQIRPELRAMVEAAKQRALRPVGSQPLPIARPRGEIAHVLHVSSYPENRLADMELDEGEGREAATAHIFARPAKPTDTRARGWEMLDVRSERAARAAGLLAAHSPRNPMGG